MFLMLTAGKYLPRCVVQRMVLQRRGQRGCKLRVAQLHGPITSLAASANAVGKQFREADRMMHKT